MGLISLEVAEHDLLFYPKAQKRKPDRERRGHMALFHQDHLARQMLSGCFQRIQINSARSICRIEFDCMYSSRKPTLSDNRNLTTQYIKYGQANISVKW